MDTSNVVVVGVGMAQFGRHLQRSVASLAEEGLATALKDTAISMADIQRACYGGVTQSLLQGQHAVPGQVASPPSAWSACRSTTWRTPALRVPAPSRRRCNHCAPDFAMLHWLSGRKR